MGIFRRGSKNGTQDSTRNSTKNSTKNSTANREVDTHAGEGAGQQDEAASKAATAELAPTGSRRDGPFDRSEVEGLEGRLDLGALWLAGFPGMELRVEVEEQSQNVVGVTAVLGESAVQLQAFAAPRNEGIWHEIRTEIAASITSQGGTADMTTGPLGAELHAQMPGQGPDGRTVFSPVRFVGVDGPRWFLRAVLSGQAALDQGAAVRLLDVVKATVVVRGDEAMAPRELLTLKLPSQPDDGSATVEGMAAERSRGDVSPNGTAPGANPSRDDLKPFERGPEITEIH